MRADDPRGDYRSECKIQVGQRFARLEVLGQVPSQGRGRRYKVQCDCGNTREVNAHSLRRGTTTSCGCYHIERVSLRAKKPDGVSERRLCLSQYRFGASERGFPWQLSDAEFYALVTQPCVYCGSSGGNVCRTVHGREPFVYTGVDRKDSQLGYTPGNAVPCCTFCNYAKNDRPLEEFEEWVARLVANRNLKTASGTNIAALPR